MAYYWPFVPHVVQAIIILLLLLLDFSLARRRNRLQLKIAMEKQRFESLYPKRSVARPYRVVDCPPVVAPTPTATAPSFSFPVNTPASGVPPSVIPLGIMLQELAGGQYFREGGMSVPGGRCMYANSPFNSSERGSSSTAALLASVSPYFKLGQATASAAACVPAASPTKHAVTVVETLSSPQSPSASSSLTVTVNPGTDLSSGSYHLCPGASCECSHQTLEEEKKGGDRRTKRKDEEDAEDKAEVGEDNNIVKEQRQSHASKLSLGPDRVLKMLASKTKFSEEQEREADQGKPKSTDLSNFESGDREKIHKDVAHERSLRRFSSDSILKMKEFSDEGDKRPLLSWPTAVKISTKLRKRRNRIDVDANQPSSEVMALPESDQAQLPARVRNGRSPKLIKMEMSADQGTELQQESSNSTVEMHMKCPPSPLFENLPSVSVVNKENEELSTEMLWRSDGKTFSKENRSSKTHRKKTKKKKRKKQVSTREAVEIV